VHGLTIPEGYSLSWIVPQLSRVLEAPAESIQAAVRDTALRRQLDVPTPTLNLGCIHGGDNPNRICGQCALEFDLRPLPGMDPEQLRAAIRGKLQPLAEQRGVRIDYGPIFPGVPPFEQSAQSELVRLAERLTGQAAEAVAFGTEAPYLQQLGCETIVLGPGDIACAHQPDEYLDLARIAPTVELLRQLIGHYCLDAQPIP
jgi:acetylornithine deacetylase